MRCLYYLFICINISTTQVFLYPKVIKRLVEPNRQVHKYFRANELLLPLLLLFLNLKKYFDSVENTSLFLLMRGMICDMFTFVNSTKLDVMLLWYGLYVSFVHGSE